MRISFYNCQQWWSWISGGANPLTNHPMNHSCRGTLAEHQFHVAHAHRPLVLSFSFALRYSLYIIPTRDILINLIDICWDGLFLSLPPELILDRECQYWMLLYRPIPSHFVSTRAVSWALVAQFSISCNMSKYFHYCRFDVSVFVGQILSLWSWSRFHLHFCTLLFPWFRHSNMACWGKNMIWFNDTPIETQLSPKVNTMYSECSPW